MNLPHNLVSQNPKAPLFLSFTVLFGASVEVARGKRATLAGHAGQRGAPRGGRGLSSCGPCETDAGLEHAELAAERADARAAEVPPTTHNSTPQTKEGERVYTSDYQPRQFRAALTDRLRLKTALLASKIASLCSWAAGGGAVVATGCSGAAQRATMAHLASAAESRSRSAGCAQSSLNAILGRFTRG